MKDAEEIAKDVFEFLFGPLIPVCITALGLLYLILTLPLVFPLWWGYNLSSYADSSRWEGRFQRALEVLLKPFKLLVITVD